MAKAKRKSEDAIALLKADHEAKLQRDLAVHRHAKENDRMPGLGSPKPDDDTDENPPA